MLTKKLASIGIGENHEGYDPLVFLCSGWSSYSAGKHKVSVEVHIVDDETMVTTELDLLKLLHSLQPILRDHQDDELSEELRSAVGSLMEGLYE